MYPMGEPLQSRLSGRNGTELTWPFLHVLDERGRDTGWATLNGPIVAPVQHEQFADLRRAGYHMVGMSSYLTFPRLDNGDPLDYEAACEAWCHCFRDPAPMFSTTVPRTLISLSDFTDHHRIEPGVFRRAGHETDIDFLYVGGFDDWKRSIKNWSLAARCIPLLRRELGLRCLVIGAPTSELGPSRGVTFSAELPWYELLSNVASARFLLVPNGMDPSPRIISEALCLNVPVVVNRHILGGWHYVNRFTGAFFTDDRDVVAVVRSCLEHEPSARHWFSANHGPFLAGQRLLRLLAAVDGSLRQHSWLRLSERIEAGGEQA
jgi:glycosyltransferase involved in cell wall biosynthesis